MSYSVSDNTEYVRTRSITGKLATAREGQPPVDKGNYVQGGTRSKYGYELDKLANPEYSANALQISYKYGSKMPTPAFFDVKGIIDIPREMRGYARMWSSEIVLRKPPYGSAAAEAMAGFMAGDQSGGMAGMRSFRAGYQMWLGQYSPADQCQRTFIEACDSLYGMPDAMLEHIEFYKNDYQYTPYICINVQRDWSASKENDLDRELVQVQTNTHAAPLSLSHGVMDLDFNQADLADLADPPDQYAFDMKQLPIVHIVEQRAEDFDEADYLDTFSYTYYTYPEYFSDYVADLRSRFKIKGELETLSGPYVQKKLDSIIDTVAGLIEMPKEFRVKMQPSRGFNAGYISSMPMAPQIGMANAPAVSVRYDPTMPGGVSAPAGESAAVDRHGGMGGPPGPPRGVLPPEPQATRYVPPASSDSDAQSGVRVTEPTSSSGGTGGTSGKSGTPPGLPAGSTRIGPGGSSGGSTRSGKISGASGAPGGMSGRKGGFGKKGGGGFGGGGYGR